MLLEAHIARNKWCADSNSARGSGLLDLATCSKREVRRGVVKGMLQKGLDEGNVKNC